MALFFAQRSDHLLTYNGITPPTTVFFSAFRHKNNAKLPVTFYPTVNYVREVEDDHQT